MNKKPAHPLMILGAGGHGKVVLSTALANKLPIAGFLDDHVNDHETLIYGYRILGTIEDLTQFQLAVFGLGDNDRRAQIVKRFAYFNAWQTLIHPQAYVHSSVKIGEGTVIFAGAIVQPDTTIGKHCIINTGAIIDHDCHLDDFVHIGPGARLAGGVRVGVGTLLGIGSNVLPQVRIGRWAIIGSGAAVIDDVLDQKTVVGVPAREK